MDQLAALLLLTLAGLFLFHVIDETTLALVMLFVTGYALGHGVGWRVGRRDLVDEMLED